MTFHENLVKEIAVYQKAFAEKGIHLQLPALSLGELQLEYTGLEKDLSLSAKLPFQKRFTNPVGVYQGGMLAAAMDDVFGPLAYMTAQSPCMTLSMNVTFLRPFTPKDEEVFIKGTIIQKTKSFIFMRAEIKNKTDLIIATADSHVTILREDQLQKVKV